MQWIERYWHHIHLNPLKTLTTTTPPHHRCPKQEKQQQFMPLLLD